MSSCSSSDMLNLAGAFAVGVALGGILTRTRKRAYDAKAAARNGVWAHAGSYSHPDGTPDGFTLRTPASKDNPTGVDVMMEKWEANTAEPPHSHPGDDMTVVIEGKMSVQFFTRGAGGALEKDGARVYLHAGDVGYIAANRVHDAQYHEACKLVYVHNLAFGFKEEK